MVSSLFPSGSLIPPLPTCSPRVTSLTSSSPTNAARRLLWLSDLTVTAVPDAEGSGPWTDSDGLVVVAATDDEALALAGAAARGPVTVAVHP